MFEQTQRRRPSTATEIAAAAEAFKCAFGGPDAAKIEAFSRLSSGP
jgi:hypothetical protein